MVLDEEATARGSAELPDHAPDRCRPAGPIAACTPGVRDLHLRVDRSAQGRAGLARGPRELLGGRDRPVRRSGPGDRVLEFSSPSFDASVLELCISLPAGAALVVPPPGPLLGEQLTDVLTRQRVTHALIPPAALATVPAEQAASGLPDLRTVIVGGDACPAGTRRALGTRPPHDQFIRPDRGDRRVDVERPARRRAGTAAHRPADLEHQVYVLDGGPAAGRRSACRASCTSRARVWPAATSHRPGLTARAVYRQPLRRAGDADVPHR